MSGDSGDGAGLLALKMCPLVNESWIDDDDADGTACSTTGVNRILMALDGEVGEDDDVRNGNFVRCTGSTSARHVLGDLACLMRGAIPGVVGVMLVANMGRIAARPLRTIVAEVAPGRRLRHVNIPSFLAVMPATTGKSSMDRVFGKVLGFGEKTVNVPRRNARGDDVIAYSIGKLFKSRIIAGTPEGIRDELEKSIGRGKSPTETAIYATSEGDAFFKQLEDLSWFRDVILRTLGGDVNSYVMASKRTKVAGAISAAFNFSVRPDSYGKAKRALPPNGLLAKFSTVCISPLGRAGGDIMSDVEEDRVVRSLRLKLASASKAGEAMKEALLSSEAADYVRKWRLVHYPEHSIEDLVFIDEHMAAVVRRSLDSVWSYALGLYLMLNKSVAERFPAGRMQNDDAGNIEVSLQYDATVPLQYCRAAVEIGHVSIQSQAKFVNSLWRTGLNSRTIGLAKTKIDEETEVGSLHGDKDEAVNAVLIALARAVLSCIIHSGAAAASLPASVREGLTICRALMYGEGDARTEVRRAEHVREGYRVLNVIAGFTVTELGHNRMLLDVPANATRVACVANAVHKLGMTESEGAGLAGWLKERCGMDDPTDEAA